MPRVTKETRLLALLADGRWHDARELSEKISHRFSAYLFNLTASQPPSRFRYEKRRHPDCPPGQAWWQYRGILDEWLAEWARDQMKWV